MPITSSYDGSIASVTSIYTAMVDSLAGLVAHWPCSSAAQLTNRKADQQHQRHGTISGTVNLVASLPQNSDEAIDFGGIGSAAIESDTGLQLSAFSLSFWFRLNSLPDDGLVFPLVTKDQSGLNDGDFSVWVNDLGELIIQFQSASSQFPLSISNIQAATTYHLCVRADDTGFDAYMNGTYKGKETGFTGGWTSNSQAIRLATVPWTATLADAIIDDVALYNRVLTEAEVLELSQRTEAPTAADDTAVVPESATSVLDVVANDTFVGQKTDLTVEIVAQGSHGTATVRGDNDIDFAANAVTQDEADSFTYQITDVNGQSNVATVNLTVQDSASEGGGTLVYDWSPLASWIDGVALTSRDADNVKELSRWTDASAATVGSSLPISMRRTGADNGSHCFNRAPTGHPSIECWTPDGSGAGQGLINFGVQLYPHLNSSPRHLRTVFEVKTCKSSDPTTHKPNGKGTTTGSYPNWRDTHDGDNQVGVKYFAGLYSGNEVDSSINWWGDSTFRIDRGQARVQSAASSKSVAIYSYHFDRPGSFGQSVGSSSFKVTDAGIEGVWHRVELEIYLTTPGTVPDNARRSDPEVEPDHVGDGYVKVYITKDIDGELGTPGSRQQAVSIEGIIWHCKFDDVGSDDNMHSLANLAGFWICLLYGGAVGSQAEGWAWIRRIQVYNHD